MRAVFIAKMFFGHCGAFRELPISHPTLFLKKRKAAPASEKIVAEHPLVAVLSVFIFQFFFSYLVVRYPTQTLSCNGSLASRDD
jgi:hypothetical protein